MGLSGRSCAFFLTLAAIILASTALAGGEEESPLYARARAVAERDGYRIITTDALLELLGQDRDALLIDVRFDYEYAEGHIPGAVNMPVDLSDRGDLSGDRLQAFRNVLGEEKGRPIIIYCRDFR